jgi:hypothetical protein
MSYQKTKSNEIENFLGKIQRFEKESHVIFSGHETSKSRIVNLEHTYKRLSGLSLNQDELFRQSLRCIENELYRAAHVMAWAGFVDYLDEKLASDGFTKLKANRPNWNFSTLEDLREISTEFARVEAAKIVGLCSKTEMKAFHGLLNKRNESAHPSSYYPDLNETLGYISELLKRIEDLKPKVL